MHVTALRALGEAIPVNLKLVVEGSEETTGAPEGFVPGHADLLRADAILICDAGNAAVGHPAITVSLRGVADVIVHVAALASELHSGLFAGAAPDALAALVADTYPEAELILLGVEEPLARIHAPNESVDPAEIAAMALTEALFLQRYAALRG
jgi:acetylornithine deacetylase/succinyl-diaminopimelate desuccinylase-like protein